MLFNGTIIIHKSITGRICGYYFISRPVNTFMLFNGIVITHESITDRMCGYDFTSRPVSTFMLFNGTVITHKYYRPDVRILFH
jgi:hypothetical protein